MSFFQSLLMAGTGFNPGGGTDYYVSETGTGNGLSPATPMSPAAFAAIVLVDEDRAFFLEGDEF